MSNDELMTRGLISTLTAEQQAEVTRVAQAMRDLIASAPEGIGHLAFALVGFEIQGE